MSGAHSISSELIPPERFGVTYRLLASSLDDARAFAEAIAVENTVEIPRDIVPAGYIEDTILGRVESVEPLESTQMSAGPTSSSAWRATLSFHIDSVGRELPQLLNVMFGNASILPGVKLLNIHLNDDVRERFPGARFGAAGVRALTNRARGGLLCAVIKPQGSSVKALAELCYQCARAGADLIKEDHGLANQDAAPLIERIDACAEEIERANEERAQEERERGEDPTRALYFASLGCHADAIRSTAYEAKARGADGVLLIPGLTGFDALQRLARDSEFALPIMAHPAFAGPYVLSPDTGISHRAFFGDLMRLAGADISVFPNWGGRFGFTQAECAEIIAGCRDLQGLGRVILPSPGGGMSVERIPEMMRDYGPDTVYLLGGSLLRLGARLGEGIRELRAALDVV